MKRISLLLIGLLAFSMELRAESMVWVAEKDGRTIYIGGSVHLLSQSDFPLPIEFISAYEAADIIVFETDLGEMNSSETQEKIMAEAMLPEGETLENLLSEEAYTMIETYCAKAGLAFSAMSQFKPSMIILSIAVMEMGKLGVVPDYGIDIFFHRRAIGEGKQMSWLEEIDEQIEFLTSMGEGYESELVIKSFNDLEDMSIEFEQMKKYWKMGDEKKLEDLIMVDFKEDYPTVYKTLVLDRNDKWMKAIEDMFLTDEDEFVLVGALHLVGEEGIISRLKEQGCDVKKMK